MATKVAFIAPWIDDHDQHLSAYACDLTRRQNNAKKYEVNITDDNKVTQLVACIYEADILEDSVMEKWEESGDHNCTNTVKHFVKEYGVVNRAAERAAQRAGFNLAATLREHERSSLLPTNSPPPAAPGPSTEDYNSMTEYAKALEQDNLELSYVGGGSSDNHTSLSEIPETAASAISTNTTTLMLEDMERERKETASQMKQLTDIILSAATKKTLFTPPPLPPPAASTATRTPPAKSSIRPQNM